MGPPHFLRDNLISVRVIDVLLEQLHVPFCLAVLLLKEAFPIVLIPGFLWLIVRISHIPFLYLRFELAAKVLSRIVWSRSWPQAALISWPFSRRIVASTPRFRRSRRNARCRVSEGRLQLNPWTVLYGIRLIFASNRVANPESSTA